MSEHLSAEQIERYRRRAMPPTERLAVDDHLATCAACRQDCRDEDRLQDTLAAIQEDLRVAARTEPQHLRYEQLSAYVDGTLDEVDREAVESHLGLCPRCVAEVNDLRAYIATINTAPVKEYAP